MTDFGVTPHILINVNIKRFVLKEKMPVVCSRETLHRKIWVIFSIMCKCKECESLFKTQMFYFCLQNVYDIDKMIIFILFYLNRMFWVTLP